LWRETTVWVPGDAIIIDLPMRVRVTRPDPRIDAVRGSVALERGPVVYCLEEEDAGGPDPLEALRVPSDLDVKIAKLDIVGEVMTSVDAGMVAQGMDDNNGLPYGPALPATRPGRRVQLVPYLAWGNRRPGQTMRVWIPEEVNSNGAVASPRLDDKPVASVPHEPTS
jgi:hypothetical protein